METEDQSASAQSIGEQREVSRHEDSLQENPEPQVSQREDSQQKAPQPNFLALLLPIKDLRNAKQRLVGVLTAEERFALAQAMLSDTIRAVRGIQHAQKIFVVTDYDPAMETAARYGWEVLREKQQISESASVDFASRFCAERGVTALLRLPLDLPLVQSSDIDELLATECTAPAVVIVPSRDGTGTNAILRTPPALFPSHFGPDSFAKHRGEAARASAKIIVRRNARLEMDVDDEADLRELLRRDLAQTATGKWLEESGIAGRLKTHALAAERPG
ncbi:MAG: 2-phospho-L-lactate guanylyltransferase [Candidatus Acidiferrum sp.]